MNVALFGGTFDPIHRGHLTVARAAAERFELKTVYFILADIPPHKQKVPITDYYHRYAMVALATTGEKLFVPSMAEANEPGAERPSYTIETVRRFKQSLPRSARLFFLIGIDAFLEIGSWYHSGELLRECEFIVASRPGFSMAALAGALPAALRPRPEVLQASKKQKATGTIALEGTTIHVLDGVNAAVSATEVRRAAKSGKQLNRFLNPGVAEYIKKMKLYR
jgi:nicotinate-nucleotide adenylyltransferase